MPRLCPISKAEINDLCEKLLAKNSEYSEREEDIGNKISQLNASSTKVRSQLISERKSHSESQRELEAKYTAEIKLLKSNIKTLKREATLAQKASSADKVTILSLETKIRELEGKLEDIDLERTYHDLDVMGGVIEEPVQISSSDPKEIDSLRLELKRANEDLSSKEYTIECMGKGIESSDSIYKRELDIRSSEQLKLMEENRLLRNHAEAVPLPKATAPILASSLMSPIIIYSILTLLLLEIIWIVVGKKIWNSWSAKSKEKSDRYIQTSDLHLWAYPRPGYMIGGQKFEDRN
uniref:Uncharacterized protein n=1 Tax=Rhizophagus irregularis (strain DAOM 181602 / DAOM 197198 / MUCL 43194) TaxID=747089 RepID=U9SPE6_RHIID